LQAKDHLSQQMHGTRGRFASVHGTCGRISLVNLPRGIRSTSRGLIDHTNSLCRSNQRIIYRNKCTEPAGGFYLCTEPAVNLPRVNRSYNQLVLLQSKDHLSQQMHKTRGRFSLHGTRGRFVEGYIRFIILHLPNYQYIKSHDPQEIINETIKNWYDTAGTIELTL